MSSASTPTDGGLRHTVVGHGPLVVLIMGINAPGSAWEPHSRSWSKSLCCIQVDNPGVGVATGPAAPYSTESLAEDYARLISSFGAGPVDVVGISLGGAIAQELALRHPQLVRRIVITASWARNSPSTDAMLRLIAIARTRLAEPDFVLLLQTLIWTPDWFAEHADELETARYEPLVVGADALVAQVAACRTHHTLPRLGQISAPTLVTAGARDRFIPAELSREIAHAVPGAHYEEFAGSGHVHHWEELERYNRLIADWLR